MRDLVQVELPRVLWVCRRVPNFFPNAFQIDPATSFDGGVAVSFQQTAVQRIRVRHVRVRWGFPVVVVQARLSSAPLLQRLCILCSHLRDRLGAGSVGVRGLDGAATNLTGVTPDDVCQASATV